MSTTTIPRVYCKCDRCGHVWAPRPGRATVPNAGPLPRICPKCKRDDWHVVGKALAVLACLALAGCATTGSGSTTAEAVTKSVAEILFDVIVIFPGVMW